MGNYDPGHPYVIGNAWAPLVADAAVLDTSSETGYTFQFAGGANDTPFWARVLTTTPPAGQPDRVELLCNVWTSPDAVNATGPLRQLTIPVISGSLQTGATLQGGAASVEAAVANPSDAGYVQLAGAASFCRFWFDTTDPRYVAALDSASRRILDVSILYSVSGPFDDVTSLPAMTIGLERPSSAAHWIMDEAVTGPTAQTANTTIRRSRFGELNPFWIATSDPAGITARMPWVYEQTDGSGLANMSASGGTNVNVRVSTGAGATGLNFQVHYLAMLVTYGEESRLMAGGLSISGGAALLSTEGLYAYSIPLLALPGLRSNVSASGNPMSAGSRYAVTLGQSYSGQQSVESRVTVPVNTLDSVEVFAPHEGVLLRKTLRVNAVPTVETTAILPSITLYDADPFDVNDIDTVTVIESSHAYASQLAGAVSASWFQPVQLVLDDVAATFTRARFYARRSPETNDPLVLEQVDGSNVPLGPQGQITVADFDALPEIVDGWKEVTVDLDPAATFAGGGGTDTTRWMWSSITATDSPWQILGADARPDSTGSGLPESTTTYGSEAAVAEIDGYIDDSGDYTLMLAQDMDAVDDLAVVAAVQPLTVVDEHCHLPVEAIPTGIVYHALTWTAVNSDVVAQWGAYEVQRQDDTMDAATWETIGLITNPATASMDDYEARVGVESRYRIRMLDNADFPGPWSTDVAITLTAPGITGEGVDVSVLVFTTNHDPGANLAYVMTWDGRSALEEFDFPEGTGTDLQQMYQRDYQVAFRPTERGGTQFTRTLLVNASGVPTSTMDKTFTGLRDLAWDTVPYVCVRDELANRWLSTIMLPGASVRRVYGEGHLALAQLGIYEVTATPAPVDEQAPCEGLVAGGGAGVEAEATTPTPAALLGTVLASDDFSNDTTDGWNGLDVGGSWTTSGGAATDFDKISGTGRMDLTSANVFRNAVVSVGTPDFDETWELNFGAAAATTAPITWWVVGRYTDANNYVVAQLELDTSAAVRLRLFQRVAGVLTALTGSGTTVLDTVNTALTFWRISFRGLGTRCTAAAQNITASGAVGLQSGTTSVATGNLVGVLARRETGNTAAVVVQADNFVARQYPVEVDLRFQVRVHDDQWIFFGQVSSTLAGGGDYGIQADQAGVIFFVDNVTAFSVTSSAPPLTKNRRMWLRVTYEASIGAGNGRATFYTSEDGAAWTQYDQLTDDATPLATGAGGTLLINTDAGITIISAQVRSSIGGTVVASPDFEAEPAGTTSFDDAQANIWTIDDPGGLCAA